MKVIAVLNEKGGTGKTTTAINIGAFMAKKGKRVLLVDCDHQLSLTKIMRMDKKKNSLSDVLMKKCEVEDAIYKWKSPNEWWAKMLENLELYIMPSSELLWMIEDVMHSKEGVARYQYLKAQTEILAKKDLFDIVILDLPPGISLIASNGIAAADYLLIPAQPEYASVHSTMRLINKIEKVKKDSKSTAKILGVVVVQYDARLQDHKLAWQFMKKQDNVKVYETYIKRLSIINNSNRRGTPAVLTSEFKEGAIEYKKVAKEVLREIA